MSGKKSLGDLGERAVKKYLLLNGFKIIETNFRSRAGELDIVAMENKTVVFIEVKTRTSDKFGSAEESVDYRKQQQIRKMAVEFLSKYRKLGYNEVRFDVATVSAAKNGKVKELKIHKAVF